MRGVWLLLLLTGCCSAQQGEYALAGSVVNSRTGDPVKRALVTAIGRGVARGAGGEPERPIRAARPLVVTVFSDVSGAFRFTGLASGTYNLMAQKPHFVGPTAAEDEPIHLESSSKENVRIELSPLGTIEGKITDQHGQPALSVSVLVIETSIVDGARQTSAVRDVWTDDRGMFRVWDMAPGRYLVRATGRGSQTSAYMADAIPSAWTGFAGFVPAYFGGPTADSATPVVIEPGTEAHADMGVVVQPAHKVRGTLANLGAEDVTFTLLSGEEDVGAGLVMFSRTSGAFEMLQVIDGSYTLRVRQRDKAVSETSIVVAGGDVDGLQMALAGPVDIPVNVGILGQPEAQEVQRGFRANSPAGAQGFPGFCHVTLRAAGSDSAPVTQGRAGASISALPGRYRAAVSCVGAYLLSAAMGTKDLLADPWITVPPGAAPAPIEIVARHGGGGITGTIKLDREPAGEATYVLAVPSGSPHDPIFEQAFESGGSQFSLNSLAPGDYTLYAFSTDQVEYRNPEFLRALSGGESVHVEDGAAATVTITRLVQ